MTKRLIRSFVIFWAWVQFTFDEMGRYGHKTMNQKQWCGVFVVAVAVDAVVVVVVHVE